MDVALLPDLVHHKNDGGRDDHLDWAWLDAQPAAGETPHLRRVRLAEPLTVVLDGRRGRGLIAKPGAERLESP